MPKKRKMKGKGVIDDRKREEAEKMSMSAEDKPPVRVVSMDSVVKKPRPAPVRRNTQASVLAVETVPEKKPRPAPVRKNADPVRVARLIAQSDLMEMGQQAKKEVMEEEKRRRTEFERDKAQSELEDMVKDRKKKARETQFVRNTAQRQLESTADKAKAQMLIKERGLTDSFIHDYFYIKYLLENVKMKADESELFLSQRRQKLLDKLETAVERMGDLVPSEVVEEDYYQPDYVAWYDIGISNKGENLAWYSSANDDIQKLTDTANELAYKFEPKKKPRPAPVRKNKPAPAESSYAVRQTFRSPDIRENILSYALPDANTKVFRKVEKEYGMPIEFLKEYFQMKDMYNNIETTDISETPDEIETLLTKFKKVLNKLEGLMDKKYDEDDFLGNRYGNSHGGSTFGKVNVIEELGLEEDTDSEAEYDSEGELIEDEHRMFYNYHWTQESVSALKRYIKKAQKLYKETVGKKD